MISLPIRSSERDFARTTFPLSINHTMLSTLSTFTNAICAPMFVQRSSTSISYIIVDFITGTCSVEFKSGYRYDYSNVSRRAILNLLKTENISLGFWVNNNCIKSARTKEQFVHAYTNIAVFA